jgi:Zn-finger nucleic acid-binding protein
MTDAVGMPCPVCKVPLVMSERQGVEIDYCPQCRGVWLDRGELDKIIERAAQDSAPPPEQAARAPAPQSAPQAAPPPQPGYAPQLAYPPQGYAQPSGYGHGYPYKKRKKSFLEELFD